MTGMTPQQAELYDRIRSFRLDPEGATYTFAQRLAKENGWSAAHAARVIAEYRKFAFLAAAAGHPVSPPEAVDQAWHLHLIYTRSYWDEFCGKVLGTPLHHEPGTGAFEQRARFDDWYARTLASYQRLLGEEPPADIWPEPAAKAKADDRFRRVDVGRNWVVPKARAGTAVAAVVALVFLLAFAAGCGRAGESGRGGRVVAAGAPLRLNPFDRTGPQFLVLYAGAAAAALFWGWMIRSSAYRSEDGSPPRPAAQRLDPYEIAYLNGGPVHAVNAAVTTLVHRRTLRLNGDGTLSAADVAANPAHEIERAVVGAVAANGGQRTRAQAIRAGAIGAGDAVGASLKAAGLVVPDDAARGAMTFATLAALTAPAVGAVKIVVGLSRDKPVGFLVAACVVSTVLALVLFARKPHRTRRGDAALEWLKGTHGALRSRPRAAVGDAMMLGVALFGLDFLADTPLNPLAKTLRPGHDAGFHGSGGGCGSSGGASSCGAGSGCGGGGGCGGCGGGGCGGG